MSIVRWDPFREMEDVSDRLNRFFGRSFPRVTRMRCWHSSRLHRVERSYGSFLRTFTAPAGIDAQKIQAEYKDSVLSVHLPKSPNQKSQATEIKIS